jgi:hypothetical protein
MSARPNCALDLHASFTTSTWLPHIRRTGPVGSVKGMTETPGRPSDRAPEPQPNETPEATPAGTSEPVTEPVPAATSEPVTEPTPAATSEPVTEPTPAATDVPTTEPTPDATGEPTAEPTPAATSAPTAGVTGQSRARSRWPENLRNRIAAAAAIVVGTVAVVAASFTGGFVAGAHSGAAGEHQARWGHHSEMAAYPEHTRTGQIWIIPGGETAQGEAYVIAETR